MGKQKISIEIQKGRTPKAWAIGIYGVPGCGKSTLASLAPKPLFLDLDGGVDRIDCHKTAHIGSWALLQSAIKYCYSCDYETIVIDTLQAVESLLIKKILDKRNQGRKPEHYCHSIADKEEFPYGLGFELLKNHWALFARAVLPLKNKGKNIILIAHEILEVVQNPQGENFDRYTMDIHRKSLPLIISQLDGVFYMHYEKIVRSKSRSDDRKIAVGSGERVLQTQERPFCIAKNRFRLPEKVSFNTKEEIAKFFTALGN